jgi:ADP-heptose:LPS heptosyltransferase
MNILLTRCDRIGDLVLSTPAIATVRASFPDAHISMVCSTYNRVVMERSSDVDELRAVPGEASAVAYGRDFRGKVDVAIALAPLRRDLQIVGATRAPIRAGYTYQRRYVARLTSRLYVNRLMISEADPQLCERDPHRIVRHEVDQLLDLVALAGARTRKEDLVLPVRDEDRAAIAFLPEAPLVMHLGLRWFADGSSLPSTLTLMKQLRGFGIPLVVTYAPECERYVQAIAESRLADVLVGGLPFYRWAAVLERARVVVTVDTGATHVASAMRRPSLVVFEHRYFRLSAQEWAPYHVPYVLVRKPSPGSPEQLAAFRCEVVDGVARLLNDA